MARVVAVTAGRASGTMPRATASASVRETTIPRPKSALLRKTTAARTIPKRSRKLPKWLRLTSKSPGARMPLTSEAVSPNCVRAPVAATTPEPWPPTTIVPAKATSRHSVGVGEMIAPIALPCGTDSPVSVAWLISSPSDSRRRRSPGTTSPPRRVTTSPGTRWLAGTNVSTPSLRTRACSGSMARRAAKATSARYSWTMLRPTLMAIRVRMITPSTKSPVTIVSTAATASRMFIPLRSCARAIPQSDRDSAPTSFNP